MNALNLKPTHKAVREYYAAIGNLAALGASHEGAVSPAFAELLRHCAHQFKWTLVPEFRIKRNGQSIRVDGALVDAFNLRWGVWEAKDSDDDLEKEVKKKFATGYPRDNILFQAPDHIIIWQHSQQVFNEDITQPERLVDALRIFFEYQPPAFEEWQKAVEEFKLKVPELADGLLKLIEKERTSNNRFIQAFDDFASLCRQTINPNISVQAVEEMLIQHMLTERIFRKVFKNPDFVERNVIAREIEKVVVALTSQYFSRDDFLRSLDRFYGAIEITAATIDDFTQKQSFLNTVYEKFFQGFSVKTADTHGIVYTPQPIVSFMVESVEEVLRREFGRSLSDEGVHIIDPFVGTGSFIVRIMREMQKSRLPQKYAIEHEYYELTGGYQPFEGICLVDTFELAEGKQLPLITEENTARVKRQQETPIFVIIGNPPYNAGQVNENDNNRNRKYPAIDGRVSRTYGRASEATLLRKLSDPYVKAIRWASDRVGEDGIVAFVTNNSFVTEITFDGMRQCLERDFDAVYVLDLGGNVRKNPKLSGTTHNVFGIQVGVCVSLFVKKKTEQPKHGRVYYARVDETWRKEEKYDFLDRKNHIGKVVWQEETPDAKHNWLTEGMSGEFGAFLPLGTKKDKGSKGVEARTVFKLFSLGVGTNRDEWVYDFQNASLEEKVKRLIHNYNLEVARFSQEGEGRDIDRFVNNAPSFVKWTDRLKEALRHRERLAFVPSEVRYSMYRPFVTRVLYFDHLLNQRRYLQSLIFPAPSPETENRAICVPTIGSRTDHWCLCVSQIPNLNLGSVDAAQCFPLYTYSGDGSNRRENITDWALSQFRERYKDNHISKWDIFHYVYAILHHPQYREKYAANLKRELPRIPFAPEFRAFAQAGAKLEELHVNYEDQPEYPLQRLENKAARLDWRVDKMRLSADKAQLVYNDFLTLGGIPAEAFEYRLGNRSALEWIVDQYQVKIDKRSGIVNDPNRQDDPEYIVRLIGKVITVSLETVKIVKGLPCLE